MKQNHKATQAIDTQADMQHTNISGQEKQIIAYINQETAFVGDKIIWRSDYFGTGKLGAFHVLGEYKGKSAVLKIQAAKPAISEAKMIRAFAAQNQSKIIRPPKVYANITWSMKHGYEAIIMEYISGEKVIHSGKLLISQEIAEFYKYYQEYRQHCRNQPWLAKPSTLEKLYEKLKKTAKRVKPQSKLRNSSDVALVDKAEKILRKVWQDVELEFQHGHFSAEDLMRKGREVILLGNLFWKWRYPYHDAVFAYHWHIYTLTSVKNITPEKIEKQRALWHKAMFSLPQVDSEREKILLNAALLERAIAGLLIDSHAYIDEKQAIAKHMVDGTRAEVIRLTQILEDSL